MSDAEERNDKWPEGNGAGPTRSFDGSVTGPGTQIGPFRIERELGRGAVGVVYLAHDTKLDRLVAIKSLPAEVMANPKARSRFSREARLLASVNHPNIATIHEVLEEAEGVGYLVLEYVPGQTLAERIAKSKLKLKEALTIALQIAEAVAAAHEHGVIHRDLKPGNIKITPEGKVKVLDFGLAKAVGGEAAEQQSTITEPGRVIGTPAYMSPEQARGQVTDKRSDIWAFGCVLYEMLTGKIPFEGETVSDTLAGILDREPDWHALPQTTPANIQVLLRRCLEKDLHRRLQHIGDASIEISETLTLPAVMPPVTTFRVTVPQPSGMRQLIPWRFACLSLAVIVTSLVVWSIRRQYAPPPGHVRRFVILPETALAEEALWHCAVAISPDGERLAYVDAGSDGRRRIHVLEFNKFKSKPIPGTEGAISPFFSPDGESLGFVDHFQRKLKKVSIKGGWPVTLADSALFAGGCWGQDDTIVFAPGWAEGLWSVSASGTGLKRLTLPDPNSEWGHAWPQLLPGGTDILFTSQRKSGSRECQIEVCSLGTGLRRTLFTGGTCARYVRPGYIIYASKETLYAVRFDIKQLNAVGPHFPVVPEVMTPPSHSAQFDISEDGLLIYIPVQGRSTEFRPVWVDKEGQIKQLIGATPRNYNSVRISPDGARAAFGITDGDKSDIWIYDLARDTALLPLTSDGKSVGPVWTRDGQRVIYASGAIVRRKLLAQRADTPDKPEHLPSVDILKNPTSCSPTGTELLVLTYDPNHPETSLDLWVVSLENTGSRTPRPFCQQRHNERGAVWSPDGQWVAYQSDESGRWEVYVKPYPGSGSKTTISAEGGCQPVWSRDGKQLFYRSSDGKKVIAAQIMANPTFSVVSVRELFEGQYVGNPTMDVQTYDVAPDGRFLMIQDPQEPTPIAIHIVQNWFEELRRLMPSGKK